ncbi:MAG: hypothetical protein IJZ56_06200 [Oscillospiraceae bacterium]|nr:hypothetical protein [Oscillospiraceae bacterium]
MNDNCQLTVRCAPEDLRQALSIHTRKITDSCRDKDCIEDLRVYLTRRSQAALDAASGAKVRCADLLCAYIDVEPVAFHRNHYCIDVTFYYRILAEAGNDCQRPCPLHGLAVFSKRAVLCGEDSSAHIFTSDTRLGCQDGATVVSENVPTAVVEVLDPMVLSSKVKDACGCKENTLVQIPERICKMFDDELILTGENRQLLVTLGQFSIIRLERDAQLVVPILDYSIPTKECCDTPGCAEDPCELFSRIPFPAESFAPRGCDCPQQDHCEG